MVLRNLRLILWTIFCMQFVIWASEYWYSDTKSLVISTLILVLLIEIILPFHWLIRRIAQLLAILAVHIVILNIGRVDEEIVPLSEGAWAAISSFFNSITSYLAQFSPFIWFCLSAWLVYLILVSFVKTKGALYSIIITSVISMGIIDSFSVFILWDQAAFLILCGLLLATIQHFAEFKKNHPTSWAYFTEYPSSIAAPVIIIISFIMLVGIMTPNVKPLLKDPYTAWKHMQGETVNKYGQLLNSGGSGSLLTSRSGYRRDDSSLGGGFNYDYTEVLRVNTTHRSYWRGESRSFYNGSGWEMSPSFQSPTYDIAPDTEINKTSMFNTSKLETLQVAHTVTLSEENSFPVLFGAYEVESVEWFSDSDQPVQWSSLQSSMMWNGTKADYPQVYNVISQVPIVDEAALKEITFDSIDPILMEEYLQLPESLPGRVTELANTITMNEITLYEKVKSIEYYLSREFGYTNTPDLSEGKSEDLVDRFLFEMQEGYCDYYSSAMVVLTRSLGIPSRWVKGFLSGSTESLIPDLPIDDLELDTGDPDAGGEYIVLNSDAHSWVEVYFEGYGWIPFEPTSGFILPVSSVDTAEAFIPKSNDSLKADPIESEDAASDFKVNPVFIVISIMLAGFIAAIIIFRKKIGVMSWFERFNFRKMPMHENNKVVHEFERLLKYAKKKGYTREEYETIRETIAAWSLKSKWLKSHLDNLLAVFERAKYGKFILTHEETLHAIKICNRVREEMK